MMHVMAQALTHGIGVDTTRRALSLLPPLMALTGCATTGAYRIPGGARVELVFKRLIAAAEAPISNLSVPADARVGWGAGMVTGALSGLSCGVWALFCVPLLATTGGALGLGGGMVVGLTGALLPGRAQALQERLQVLLSRHDLQASLQDNLTLRGSRMWAPGVGEPRFILTSELQPVGLTSTRQEQVGLVVVVRTSLEEQVDGQRRAIRQQAFEFAPAASPLSAWLDERSDIVDTQLQACGPQLAAQIVAEYSRVDG
jgi:hypothetical protein